LKVETKQLLPRTRIANWQIRDRR